MSATTRTGKQIAALLLAAMFELRYMKSSWGDLTGETWNDLLWPSWSDSASIVAYSDPSTEASKDNASGSSHVFGPLPTHQFGEVLTQVPRHIGHFRVVGFVRQLPAYRHSVQQAILDQFVEILPPTYWPSPSEFPHQFLLGGSFPFVETSPTPERHFVPHRFADGEKNEGKT